jgi:hypothetical protein
LRGESKTSVIAAALLVAIVVAAGLWGQTRGSFGGDEPYIAVNLTSSDWGDRLHAFNADFHGRHGGRWYMGVQEYQRRYIRYLPSFVMSLEWATFGSRAEDFKLVSLAIHILNCLLGFALLRRFLGSVYTAALLACVFGLHPAVRQPVDWVACQNVLLAGTCALLAIYAMVIRHAGGGALAQLGVVFAAFVGLTSLESLIAFPALLFSYDLWVARTGRARALDRPYRAALLLLYPIYVVLAYLNRSDVTTSDASYRAPIPEFFSVMSTDLANYLVRSFAGTFSAYSSELYALIGHPLVLLVIIIGLGALAFPFRKRSAFWIGAIFYVSTLGPPLLIRAAVSLANYPSTRQLYVPLIGLAIMLAAMLKGPFRKVPAFAMLAFCAISAALHWNHLPNRARGERHLEMSAVVAAELANVEPTAPIVTIGWSRCAYDLRFDSGGRSVYDLIPVSVKGRLPEFEPLDAHTLLVRSDAGLTVIVNEVSPKPGVRARIAPPPLVVEGAQDLEIARVSDPEFTETGAIRTLRFEFDRPLSDHVFFWIHGCADPERVPLDWQPTD